MQMPEFKVTYEITLGTILILLGGIGSLILILQRILPPMASAASAIMVFFAEHRLLVADLAERRGVTVEQLGDLAVAEMEVAKVNTARRRRSNRTDRGD